MRPRCKYDYSKVNYINAKSKVIIICKEHGEFKQLSNSHLSGSGCSKCRDNNISSSTNEFIEKAIKIHNDKYDYSKVNYINSYTKIKIICKEHEEFEQLPNHHLSGSGCSKCSGTYQYSTNEFIEKAIKIHGSKYDYSKVNYINAKSKVIIICKEHGEFEQQPNNHLNGQGCSNCSTNISKKEQEWITSLNNSNILTNQKIKIKNRIIKPDGYDPFTKTIYEFYGDFWHGNPKVYNSSDINVISKKTFGELYNKTLKRAKFIKDNGFNIIEIWEKDYDLKKYSYLINE
jgi:hypothetical protein